MKKMVWTAFLLAPALIMQAQKKTSLYVYSQTVSPGVPNKTVTLGTDEITDNTRSKTNYFIYLATGASDSLLPRQIWLHEKGYTIEVIPVEDPSIKKNDRVLVPESYKQIWQLTLTDLLDEAVPVSRKLKRCIKRDPVVVVYDYRGKEKYKEAPAILMLEADRMQ